MGCELVYQKAYLGPWAMDPSPPPPNPHLVVVSHHSVNVFSFGLFLEING